MKNLRTLLMSSAAVALLVALAAAPAMAAGTVSSKATAAINDAVGCTATGEKVVNGTATTLVVNCTDLFHHSAVPVTADQYVPIMDAVIKLSNSQSLFVGASEVTGLYTQTSVSTHGDETSTATA